MTRQSDIPQSSLQHPVRRTEVRRRAARERTRSRGTEGWPTGQMRYWATGCSLSRIPGPAYVPARTAGTRGSVTQGYRARHLHRESLGLRDTRPGDNNGAAADCVPPAGTNQRAQSRGAYRSRNTRRWPRRAPASPGGGVSGDFDPGGAGSGALRSTAASRTALARASRSSGLGSGGPEGRANRSTSQPRGTVSFSACGAHRS